MHVIISRVLHWNDALKNLEHLSLVVFLLCHVLHTPPNNYEDPSKWFFFFPSHVYMDQSIRETILCMREFLKVHTINYFSSPKSEFWNCSFIDRWAAVTVIGNPRKHQMLWSTYQQVKGGALKHSAYWRKAFRGCRATVTYETSDLTPASFRTSVFSKQPNKLTIFCDYQRLPGELAN